MTKPPFKMIDINDPDFGEKLLEALDCDSSDTIEIYTPSFERGDGQRVPDAPKDFRILDFLDEPSLRELGLQPWGEAKEDGTALWLFPKEWYDSIPEGMIVTSIGNTSEPFVRGETDDDHRFGALAYGLLLRNPTIN